MLVGGLLLLPFFEESSFLSLVKIFTLYRARKEKKKKTNAVHEQKEQKKKEKKREREKKRSCASYFSV